MQDRYIVYHREANGLIGRIEATECESHVEAIEAAIAEMGCKGAVLTVINNETAINKVGGDSSAT